MKRLGLTGAFLILGSFRAAGALPARAKTTASMQAADEPQSEYASRCRVCGIEAGLTFEQPPPTAAWQSNPAKVFGLEYWLALGHNQSEAPGAYTLCETCNDTAGELYLPEFREWSRAAAAMVHAGPPEAALGADPRPSWTTLELPEVRPGRFLKQVVTMLLAIAPAGFVPDDNIELGLYAQHPKRTGLPKRYQFYLSLYRGPYARFVGYSAQLNPKTGRTEELIELAYPPFSVVLSLGGDVAIETTNISDFADLGIDEECIVDLDLLNGFGHTPLPADFRTLAAVEREQGGPELRVVA